MPIKTTIIRKNANGNGWTKVENERMKLPLKRMVELYS